MPYCQDWRQVSNIWNIHAIAVCCVLPNLSESRRESQDVGRAAEPSVQPDRHLCEILHLVGGASCSYLEATAFYCTKHVPLSKAFLVISAHRLSSVHNGARISLLCLAQGCQEISK